MQALFYHEVNMTHDPSPLLQAAFARHQEVLARCGKDFFASAGQAAALIGECARELRTLFICGNGGSAADSQHFAAEFTCKYKDDREPLPAVALTVDTSALTAIGNDFGFNDIFSRQLRALGKSGDILVALSTSGKSPNILCAISEARARGMKIIAMTGSKGEHLRDAVDVLLAVPSEETARIQEVHELLYHSWCEYVDSIL
jgi:D-sedoheptulose 7-phosphate isomerase